ncbi:unnamed protein product [Polarella glacialis]|uniref:Uncharacterized protein n=1 Tax=Polarella glacialis TaxID=89957 RepID=A0A813FN56_POLGL|nr:unnamed protein product [Polarella glacialis]
MSRLLQDLADPNKDVHSDAETMVVMDFTEEEALSPRGNMTSSFAGAHDTKLQQDDPVIMWAEVVPGKKGTGRLKKSLEVKRDYLEKLLRRPLWDAALLQGHEVAVNKSVFESFDGPDGDQLSVTITVKSPFFNAKAMKDLTKGDAAAEAACRQYLQTYNLEVLSDLCSKGGLKVNCADDKSFQLKHGEHFVLGPADAPWLKK